MIQNRNELPKILNEKEYIVGVEVGAFRGQFSKIILDNWVGILYLVDVWRKLDEKQYVDKSNNEDPIDIIKSTVKNIEGHEDRAFMLRMYSFGAAKLFQNNSIDFVYIDANHRYEWVKRDIETWWPKIKKGGMLSGHDYIKDYDINKTVDGRDTHVWMLDGKGGSEYAGLFGVNLAVDEFIEKENLKLNLTKEYFGTWYAFK